MKPTVKYYIDENNFIKVGCSAFIVPIDHPSEFVSNTIAVRTSIVLSYSFGEAGHSFETENTLYEGCFFEEKVDS